MTRGLTIGSAIIGIVASVLWGLSAYAAPVPLVGAFAMTKETRDRHQGAVDRKATAAARLSAAAAALTAVSLLLSSLASLIGNDI